MVHGYQVRNGYAMFLWRMFSSTSTRSVDAWVIHKSSLKGLPIRNNISRNTVIFGYMLQGTDFMCTTYMGNCFDLAMCSENRVID